MGTYRDYGTLFIVSHSLVDALLPAGALGFLVKGLCRHSPPPPPHLHASENSLAIPWAPGEGGKVRVRPSASLCILYQYIDFPSL